MDLGVQLSITLAKLLRNWGDKYQSNYKLHLEYEFIYSNYP